MAKRSKTADEPPADRDPADATANAADQPDAGTIDSILDGLETVVGELEGGDLPLEQALSRFERGVDLARRGAALLDRVEQRVEVLLAERDETVPLSPEDGDDETDDRNA